MQAFIKNNKLIINTMIQDNEKEDLLKFINEIKSKQADPVILYNIEGNISGIAFNIVEEDRYNMYAEIKSENKVLINRLSENERILLKGICDKAQGENTKVTLKELTDESGEFGGIFLEVTEVPVEEPEEDTTEEEETVKPGPVMPEDNPDEDIPGELTPTPSA